MSDFFAPLWTVEGLVALFTLVAIEVVMGVDNIVFINILAGRLPPEARDKARQWGLNLALFMRVGLLCATSWVVGMVESIFTVEGHGISPRDLVLLGGGLYLLYYGAKEIYEIMEGGHDKKDVKRRSFVMTLVKIAGMDMIFSLDSVITAVGMAKDLVIMITAVIISVVVMKKFAGPVGGFIERHASVKVLALAFLLAVGTFLIAEGAGAHINKAYLYLPMCFASLVVACIMRAQSNDAKRAARVRREHEADDTEAVV